MVYTIIVGNRSYDKTKKTLEVTEQMEKVIETDKAVGIGIREKFNTVFSYEKDVLGADAVKEILGSDNLDEVDLSEVTILFNKIHDAYNKPITDYKLSKSREALNALPIDKVVELAKAANELPQNK